MGVVTAVAEDLGIEVVENCFEGDAFLREGLVEEHAEVGGGRGKNNGAVAEGLVVRGYTFQGGRSELADFVGREEEAVGHGRFRVAKESSINGFGGSAVVSGVEAVAIEARMGRADEMAAFERVMRQYERLVLVTALRLLGNLPDAQDVAQEVFLRLYRNLGKVDGDRAAAWLYRVTVNVCHDLRRRKPASVAVEDAPELVCPDADPQRRSVEAERRRALELSLRMLSEKERAALVLRDLEGLSTGEVARVLGSSEATVRSQISKARIKVKEFLERYFRRRV
jgi:RNA polymerase sigma-70 factor (ECF subfamily)